MGKIGIFYGSTSGNTTTAAEIIAAELGDQADEPIDIETASPDQLDEYSVLVLGIPTYNTGEMQTDWEAFAPQLAGKDWSGKKVALFGCGDQEGYPDTFGDALFLLWDQIAANGATLVGQWATDGYEFNESKAVIDGKFIGLMTDSESQEEMTEDRCKAWAQQLAQAI